MTRCSLAAVAGVVGAAAFAGVAFAGGSGSGSLTMATGFTLYEYNYSVQFSQPVHIFGIKFKRRDGRVTSVTGPPGFSCKRGLDDHVPFISCFRGRLTAAAEVLTGTVYLRNRLSPGEGASLVGNDGAITLGPFAITGP